MKKLTLVVMVSFAAVASHAAATTWWSVSGLGDYAGGTALLLQGCSSDKSYDGSAVNLFTTYFPADDAWKYTGLR